MKFQSEYEMFDNSDFILNCFGPILSETCQNCLHRLQNQQFQHIFDLNTTTNAIKLHQNWLFFEQQANEIKHIMKYIYAIGLGLSFLASFYLIDSHARKA